jgi:hypothetical protein
MMILLKNHHFDKNIYNKTMLLLDRAHLRWIFLRVRVRPERARLGIVVGRIGIKVKQKFGRILAYAQVTDAHSSGAAHINLTKIFVNSDDKPFKDAIVWS